MKRALLFLCLLSAFPAFSQNLSGRWLTHKGRDGSILVVTVTGKGTGKAELSLTCRMQAVSYGEGSQFWGTFRATGGYYYQVRGQKTESIGLARTDSTLTVTRRSKPTTGVSAWLDEAYSTRGLSEEGGYKQQVLAQWKRDFSTNADVKKSKSAIAAHFADHYADAFELLLEGEYRIVEETEVTLTLQNLSQSVPPVTWQRLRE